MNRGELEKRLFPRKLTDIMVVFEDEFCEGLIYLYARDMSLGGLYIESTIPIKIGSYVFLSFVLPGKIAKIRATGQIVREKRKEAKRGLGQREGIGIRFVGLSEESAKALSEYVTPNE